MATPSYAVMNLPNSATSLFFFFFLFFLVVVACFNRKNIYRRRKGKERKRKRAWGVWVEVKEKSLDIGGYEEDDVFDPFTSSSP